MGQSRPAQRTAEVGSATVSRRENVALRELVAVYSHLSALVSQDADVAGVVRLVARHTGTAVALLGQGLEVIVAAGSGDPAQIGERLREYPGSPRLARVLAATAQNRRPLKLPGDDRTAVVVAPVVVGDEVPAYLVTITCAEDELGADAADTTLLLTEHAATICGIFLGRDRVVAAAAGRARLDLVEGLLSSRDREDGEAERWASHLGFTRGRDHHVVAVRPGRTGAAGGSRSGAAPGRVLALIEHLLALRVPDAIVAAREHEVVAVVPVRSVGAAGFDELRRLGSDCAAAVAERHPGTTLVVGLGGACRTPAEISRSYAQARSAIEATTRMGRTGVIAFEDLGIQRLLLQVPDLAELRAFAADVLGGLLTVDGDQPGVPGRSADATRRDLLATLTAYFDANGSPQRAARELHVHANTVAYRVRRIEEITGLRLDHSRDRLMLQVALEIVNSLGGGP